MISEYLRRINFHGNVSLDSRTLISLHKAHVSAIPFENIDLMSGNKIDLSLDILFNKIILERRGGICYELNYLFYNLLSRFGFNVKMVSAITKYGDVYGQEYDHMALIVEMDGKLWLVDVGLREALWYPIDILKHRWSKQGLRSYSVLQDMFGRFHFLKMIDDKIFEEYKFSLDRKVSSEFNKMFSFHESDPRSPLNRYLLCSIEKENGRVVIRGDRIIIEEGGIVSQSIICNNEASFNKLKKHVEIFGFENSILEKLFELIVKHSLIGRNDISRIETKKMEQIRNDVNSCHIE